jgi:thymidylate synthase (FAD)
MKYKIVSNMGVHHIEHMGNDNTVVNAARISFNNKKDQLDEKDIKLIDYLAKNKHLSPFEHCSATFIIECPLFIRSQIHRHRTFAYNEISRRYTSEDLSFYVPKELRTQAKSNRQASEGELSLCANELALDAIKSHISESVKLYNSLIQHGVAREVARASLPQSLMTKFYMTGSLRNWAHFIELRIDAHAQKEAQLIALALSEAIRKDFPESFGALMKYIK